MPKKKIDVPQAEDLIIPTFEVLKQLGGSGTNTEILTQIIKSLRIPDNIADIPHIKDGNEIGTELDYRLAWARTYLKKYGAITNSTRSVWSICPNFKKELDRNKIIMEVKGRHKRNIKKNMNDDSVNIIKYPEEQQPWEIKLLNIIKKMNAYGFERLSQRILRESGFSEVIVTQKAKDGGIDGYGKFKINGFLSFNVAFQCKRYEKTVPAGDIRDFRGSLTTNIERGIFITTGTFSKSAREEATMPGKKQIDLIDGEALVEKIAELGIGVKEVKTYEIDEDFFKNI